MTLERKQILTLGPIRTHQAADSIVNIDEEFVASLQRNLTARTVEYVPVVKYTGTETPSHSYGDVVGLVVEDGLVFAELDCDEATDLEKYDAYPMMHLDYRDLRTGKKVGPALIHVMLKRKAAVDAALRIGPTVLESRKAVPTTTRYEVPDSPKMLRETLCLAQSAIGLAYSSQQWALPQLQQHIARLQRLIDECDRHRPIGPDGKHGNRHTPTCGCEDR